LVDNNLMMLKRLSQTKDRKDIHKLSYAQFPGTHCPLFGVALTSLFIADMKVLVVGTEECTYYTKMFAIGREKAGEAKDNVLSLVIEDDEVVFGAADALKDALVRIDKEYKPKAILVVTTCIPEITGENYVSVSQSMQENVEAKIICVRTEHFKCNNHVPGIERTLEALADLMEKTEVNKNTVNVLGHRHKGIEKTELFSLLAGEGISINLAIPSKSSVDALKKAPSAGLNIVTDASALPLAKLMKERFGTDYVFFGKHGSLEKIYDSYKELALKLNLNILDNVCSMYNKAQNALVHNRNILLGKNFIYGNTPFTPFEGTQFFCSLGMKALLIQVNDITETDLECINNILASGSDPLITEVANIAPLRKVYAEFKPDIYIGHEYPQVLAQHGISHAVLDAAAGRLGFEFLEMVAGMLVQACYKSGQNNLRGEKHAVS